MSNRPKSSKPSTAASSTTNKKRSEIVKFENVKDSQLPKFTAKVIVDSGNNHKPRNINSLAMKGIKPPRPRGKKASENDDKRNENMQVPGEMYLERAEPEFPPRFGIRFGSTLNIKQLKLNAETFKNDSRDFISTVKNNELKLPSYFSQSPIRRAAHSVLGGGTPKMNEDGGDDTPHASLFENLNNKNSKNTIDPYSYSNLRSDKYNSKESLKNLGRLKKVISVARMPYKLNKLQKEGNSPKNVNINC